VIGNGVKGGGALAANCKAAEPIRAASAAVTEIGGLPDAAERPQDPAVAADFDPELPSPMCSYCDAMSIEN